MTISLFDDKSGKVYDAPDEATAQAQMRAYGLTQATPEQVAAHDSQQRYGGTLSQLQTVPETAAATMNETVAGVAGALTGGKVIARGGEAYSPEAIERREANPKSALVGAIIPDIASTALVPELEGAGLVSKGLGLAARSAVAGAVAEGGETAITGDDFSLGDAALYGLTAGALEVGGHYAFTKAMKAAGATKDALDGAVDKARRWAVGDAVTEPDKALRGIKMGSDDVAEKLYEQHQATLDEALGVLDQRMTDAPEKLFTPSALKKTISDNIQAQSDHFLEVAVQLQHAADVTGSVEIHAAKNIMQDALESNGPQMYRAVREARAVLDGADLAGSELGSAAYQALDDSLRNEGVWGKAAKNYATVADPAVAAGPKSVGAQTGRPFRVDDLDAREKLGQRLDAAQSVASATGDKKALDAIKRARKAMAGADDVTGARVMGADVPVDEWTNTAKGRGAREREPGPAETGGLWNKAKNFANQIGEEEVGGLVEGGFKKAGMAVGGAVGGLPGMALGYLGGRQLNRMYGPQASAFAWKALKKGAAGAAKRNPLRAAGAVAGAAMGVPHGGLAGMAGAYAGQKVAKAAGEVASNVASKVRNAAGESTSKRIWNAVKDAAAERMKSSPVTTVAGLGLAGAGAVDAAMNPDDHGGNGTAAASVGLLAMFLPSVGRRELAHELDTAMGKLAFRERTAISRAARESMTENESLLRKFAKHELPNATADDVMLQQGKNVLKRYEDLTGHAVPLEDIPPDLFEALRSHIDYHNAAIIEHDPELLRMARVGHFDALPGQGQQAMAFAQRPRDLERFGMHGPADTRIIEAGERPVEITGSHTPRSFREHARERFNSASEAMADDMPQSVHTQLESVSRQTIADLPRNATEGQVRGAAAVAFDGWKENVERTLGRQLTAPEAEYGESALLFDASEHAHHTARAREAVASDARRLAALHVDETGAQNWGRAIEAPGSGTTHEQRYARQQAAHHALERNDFGGPMNANLIQVRRAMDAGIGADMTDVQLERRVRESLQDFLDMSRAQNIHPNPREIEYADALLDLTARERYSYANGRHPEPLHSMDNTTRRARQENALASSAPGSTRRVLDDNRAALTHEDFSNPGLHHELDGTRAALVDDIDRSMDHQEVVRHVQDAVESWQSRLRMADLPAPNERELAYGEANLMNAAAEERYRAHQEAPHSPEQERAASRARGGDGRGSREGYGERVMEDLDEHQQKVWDDAISSVQDDLDAEGEDIPHGDERIDQIVERLREQHVMDPEDEIYVRKALGEDEYPMEWSDADDAIDGAVRTLAGYGGEGDSIDADDIIRMIHSGETSLGNQTLTPMEERQIRGRIDGMDLERDYNAAWEEINPPDSSEPPSSGGGSSPSNGRSSAHPDGLPPERDLDEVGLVSVDMHDRKGIENVFGEDMTLRDLEDMFALEHFRTYAESTGQDLETKLIVNRNEVNFEGKVGGLQLDTYYRPGPNGGVQVEYAYARVPADEQGRGMFRKMIKPMFEGMERRGATEVRTSTAIEVGKHAWLALGMRPARPEAEEAAKVAYVSFLEQLEEGGTHAVNAKPSDFPTTRHIADAVVPIETVQHKLPQMAALYAAQTGSSMGDAGFAKQFIAGDQFRAGKAFLLSTPGPWNSDLRIKIDRGDPWFRECLKRIGLLGAAGLTGAEAMRALQGTPLEFTSGGERQEQVDPAQLADAHEQAQAEQQKQQTRAQLDYLKAQKQNAIDTTARALVNPAKNTRTVPRAPGVSNSAGVQAFMGTQTSMHAAFNDKRASLQKLQQDPMILVDEMADSFGALADAAPDLHRQVVAQTYKVASFLADKMPGTIGASLTRPEGTPVSGLAVRQFALYYSAATNPSTVLTDLTHNRAQKEQVDTLKQLWPDTYGQLKQAMIEQMSQGRPTFAQRQRVDLLFDFGESLDTALSSRLVASLEAYKQTPKGQGKADQEGKGAPPPAMPTRKSNPSIVATGALGSLHQGATAVA